MTFLGPRSSASLVQNLDSVNHVRQPKCSALAETDRGVEWRIGPLRAMDRVNERDWLSAFLEEFLLSKYLEPSMASLALAAVGT